MTALLTISDLHMDGFQERAWKQIVRGVSLQVNRGEVLGLIGESGAGKSTLGLASMGFCRPGCRIASGSVEFDGQVLTGAAEAMLRNLWGVRMCYVAQSAAAAFNPAHRLLGQCAEAPVQHGLMRTEAAESLVRDLFAKLALPDPEKIGTRFPHQVSGGQLQRTMLAMALATRPDFVVFDEPTTALDVTTQIEVLAAIKLAIRQFGMAAIYISHNLAVVAQIADRILVLRGGVPVEEAPTRELLEHPQEDYTRALLAVRKGEGGAAGYAAREAVLEVRDVSAAYGNGPRVLENVSLTLNRGSTVAVVGESGSGKSTLARVITGLLVPAQGTVRFGGKVLPAGFRERDRDTLRRLQMIYQMPDVALNPRQRVGVIVGRPLQLYSGLHGHDQHRAIVDLLEQVELPARYVDRYPTELSGGEKQRVCIARALAARPEVIICDEITSALDQLIADGILKLLRRLQNELGMSYLFISHDIATVRVMADDIVVMFRGRVVQAGAREQVLAPPHHEYTELLLASVPDMDPGWLDKLLATRAGAKLRQGGVGEQFPR